MIHLLRQTLPTCLLGLGILLVGMHLSSAAEPPNVILIMTDDQGYGELSAHGNPVLRTPHLDRLHDQSVRLTDFHVAPMCTPTRGQLMTGLDAARNGAINVSSGRTLLRAGLPTLADLLAARGYRTGIFGKWHLGDSYPYRPQDRGFQESLWFPSSHINSTPDVWNNDYFNDTYRHNGATARYEGYCTDVFFTEALRWMKERLAAGERFFCYLPTNAPHWPHWVPDRYRADLAASLARAEAAGTVPKLPPRRRRALVSYLAMIRNIDDNIGRLEEFLTGSGIVEETLLIFLTDNGSTFAPDYYPAGMRGRKTTLWEGGHRVPCFLRWPAGDLGAPRDVAGLTQVQDLAPTVLDLCGIEPETRFDGLTLAPALRGQAPVPEERMLVINYSRMPFGFDFPAPDSPSIMRREGAAVLWKQWRLLEDKALYNLRQDPLQRTNVLELHPGVAGRLRTHLDAWWNDVKDRANEPQPVVLGDVAENPVMLTACEWLDVFIDQQLQVRRGEQKNGWWEIDVARAGRYEIELRRWPREANAPLREGLPAVAVEDGMLPEGLALPIAAARLRIGTRPPQTSPVAADTKSVTFTTSLDRGRTRLYTWFLDARNQPLLGAYYVYVHRQAP